MSSTKYVLVKHKKIKILVNEGLHIQPLIDHLSEIELLNEKVTHFYKNLLSATDECSAEITKQQQTLTSKIGYKIIGVPFSNHDAELYALDRKLDYQILELKLKSETLQNWLDKWQLSATQGAKILKINKSKASEYLSLTSSRTLPAYVEAHIETFNLLAESKAKKLIEKRLK